MDTKQKQKEKLFGIEMLHQTDSFIILHNYIHKMEANDCQEDMKYTSDNVSRLSIYMYVYLITIYIIHNCSHNYFIQHFHPCKH